MSFVTLKKACEITSKSKRTIQRYISTGKVSSKTNDLGEKEVNTTELMLLINKKSPHDKNKKLSPQASDTLINDLLSRVNQLEKDVDLQSKLIDRLLQSNAKTTKTNAHNISDNENLKPVTSLSRANSLASKKDNTYAIKNNLPNNITEELHLKIMELSKKGLSGNKIADVLPVSKSTINRVISISKKAMLSE